MESCEPRGEPKGDPMGELRAQNRLDWRVRGHSGQPKSEPKDDLMGEPGEHAEMLQPVGLAACPKGEPKGDS